MGLEVQEEVRVVVVVVAVVVVAADAQQRQMVRSVGAARAAHRVALCIRLEQRDHNGRSTDLALAHARCLEPRDNALVREPLPPAQPGGGGEEIVQSAWVLQRHRIGGLGRARTAAPQPPIGT